MADIVSHRVMIFNFCPIGFGQFKALPLDIVAHKGS